MTIDAEVERLRTRLGPPEESHPLLESLDELLGRGADIGAPALLQLFGDVARDYLPARLNTLLRYQLTHPEMEVAGVHLHAWVVHLGSHYSINLSLIETVSRHLHWQPFDALLCRLSPGAAPVRRFRLPSGVANDVVDQTARLEPAGSEVLEAGGILVKRADTDIFDFEASPDRPVLIARLHGPAKGPLDWTFDRESLSPIAASGNDLAESQLISLIRTAAVFSDSDLGLLHKALDHSSHSVRWAALQAIGKLDRDAAAALLPSFARDPHPHVRRAAERTLARLEA